MRFDLTPRVYRQRPGDQLFSWFGRFPHGAGVYCCVPSHEVRVHFGGFAPEPPCFEPRSGRVRPSVREGGGVGSSCSGCFSRRISIRRLALRPSAVLLSPTGSVSPIPSAWIRFSSIPSRTR